MSLEVYLQLDETQFRLFLCLASNIVSKCEKVGDISSGDDLRRIWCSRAKEKHFSSDPQSRPREVLDKGHVLLDYEMEGCCWPGSAEAEPKQESFESVCAADFLGAS